MQTYTSFREKYALIGAISIKEVLSIFLTRSCLHNVIALMNIKDLFHLF